MSLPFDQNRTYNPNSPLASADMNSLQTWLVHAWEAIAGGHGYRLDDDFQTTLSSTWNGAGLTNGVIVDDAANGAFGSLKLPAAAGGSEILSSNIALPLGGRVWRLSVRAALVVAPNAGTSLAQFGVVVSPAAQGYLVFQAVPGEASWQVKFHDGTNVQVQTVPVPIDGAYHVFEARSDGVNIAVVIDGTAVWSVALPAQFRVMAGVGVLRDNADAAAVELRVDSYRLYAQR